MAILIATVVGSIVQPLTGWTVGLIASVLNMSIRAAVGAT